MSREDIELYVSGNFDGDVAALERAIAEDPAMAEMVADEARFEMLLRDAAAAAEFCPACAELVRAERCDQCGAAKRPGGYVVERVLVSNAHGRMYVARDADGKQVALKELAFVQTPSASTIEAFEREAKFLRALEHPAIPRFVASFEEGKGVHTRYYLAQELVTGKPLDQLDDHWYSEAEIVDVARQVLQIIVYLQSLSPMVIHRDIKPANLIRRADGSIALVDFGAAYAHGSTAGVTTIGTFGYMPVEQLAGILDATTDCYALGASLLYLLTRQEPWRLQQSKTTVNVSAPLRAFLDKLVANDPRERFPSAKDALAALERRDEIVVGRPRERRNWARPTLIAAVTMMSLAGGGAAIYHLSGKSPSSVEQPVPAAPQISFLRISMPADAIAELYVDDVKITSVRNGTEVPVRTGTRKVKMLGPNGAKCENEVEFPPERITTLECLMQLPSKSAPGLDVTKLGTWSFKDTNFHDAMLVVGKTCGLNVVVPEYVDTSFTVNIANAPCNVALETMLESRGLWYVYDPPTKLVRVGIRRSIEADRDKPALPSAALPEGSTVTFEKKDETLRDVLAALAKAGGDLNLVVPDHIDGNITVKFVGVPWDRALIAVLEANGLWYRYRENGKLLSIAIRRELEAER